MNRKHIVRIGIAALLLTLCSSAIYLIWGKKTGEAETATVLKYTVRKDVFHVRVTATGELSAKRSVKIRAPQGMNAAGIWETTITDLVAEGSLVNEGAYVATLDRTELANKMSTIQTEIEKIQTQLEQARIDTAIELRGIRDELVNLDFSKQEKLLYLDQSGYEPQSVIQTARGDDARPGDGNGGCASGRKRGDKRIAQPQKRQSSSTLMTGTFARMGIAPRRDEGRQKAYWRLNRARDVHRSSIACQCIRCHSASRVARRSGGNASKFASMKRNETRALPSILWTCCAVSLI